MTAGRAGRKVRPPRTVFPRQGRKENILKKQVLKTRGACKVTFTLSKEAVKGAKTVHLVGEFNGWDPNAAPMKRMAGGSFQISLTIESGRAYQFRYLIDGRTWENDWAADRYVPSSFGADENSVVDV
jgi:1,4-alpha-glucan branching enzyme